MKQKESTTNCNWIQLLRNHFAFIKEDFSEDIILKTSKDDYNRYIKQKVEIATINEYLEMKQKFGKKLGSLQYTDLSIQHYMVSTRIRMRGKTSQDRKTLP